MGDFIMENEKKLDKWILYLIISIISYIYLIMPQNAAVSVPVFTIIQFVMIYLILPKTGALVLFAPIFLVSLSYFTSQNYLLRPLNFIVLVCLYNAFALFQSGEISAKDGLYTTFEKFTYNVFTPFSYFGLPFKKLSQTKNTKTIRRVLLGVLISIPCILFLTIMLSSSDMVFSYKVGNFIKWAASLINLNALFKIIVGIFCGFYLFGLMYKTTIPKGKRVLAKNDLKADFLVLNIVLFSILAIYTLFVAIQFKYLFAKGQLPSNLTYAQYARRGFFELVVLSVINTLINVAVGGVTKEAKNKWSYLTKFFNCYLCLVSFVLLSSSYYRMKLYSNEFGLTRLRYMVYVFLAAEAIGLAVTLYYIIRPRLNIIFTYALLALAYILILNLIPMDKIIAKNQIDKYLAGNKADIDYVLTLSADAAGEVERLLSCGDEKVRIASWEYFENHIKRQKSIPSRWQRWNLSGYKLERIYETYAR